MHLDTFVWSANSSHEVLIADWWCWSIVSHRSLTRVFWVDNISGGVGIKIIKETFIISIILIKSICRNRCFRPVEIAKLSLPRWWIKMIEISYCAGFGSPMHHSQIMMRPCNYSTISISQPQPLIHSIRQTLSLDQFQLSIRLLTWAGGYLLTF